MRSRMPDACAGSGAERIHYPQPGISSSYRETDLTKQIKASIFISRPGKPRHLLCVCACVHNSTIVRASPQRKQITKIIKKAVSVTGCQLNTIEQIANERMLVPSGCTIHLLLPGLQTLSSLNFKISLNALLTAYFILYWCLCMAAMTI